MPEEKVTCRYCGSEEVDTLPVPGGSVPICDRHRQQLERRALAELDRIMGEPVNNDKVLTDGNKPADAGPAAGPKDPSF